MLGHFADNRLGKSAGYRRGTDQHGGPHLVNHFGQVDAASRPVAFPALHFGGRARIRRLIIAHAVTHVVGQQAVGVDQPETRGGFFARKSLTHHRIADLIGNS